LFTAQSKESTKVVSLELGGRVSGRRGDHRQQGQRSETAADAFHGLCHLALEPYHHAHPPIRLRRALGTAADWS
jgi:hypothetical protein